MTTSFKHMNENDNQKQEKQAINYAQALRKLKQVSERLQKRKNQIKAQGMRSDRGRWQVAQAQKKAQMRKEMKDQNVKLQNKFTQLRAKQLQKVALLKKQAQKIRQENFKKRSMSRLEVLQNKIRLNHNVREKSLHATERIIHLRQQQLQKKREKRLSMYGSRKQSRRSFEQFQMSRISMIRDSTSRQRDQLLQKLKSKEKELFDLQIIQTQSSRLKEKKEESTAENLKSIDSRLKIYNPSSARKKQRKRSMSDYRFLKQGGAMITQV